MKRKRAEGHANHERWLVSYADFITLLFAFFVVLYSSSQVDRHKMARLAVAIEGAFHRLGVFPGSVPGAPVDVEPGPPPSEDKKASLAPQLEVLKLEATKAERIPAVDAGAVAALKHELETVLAQEIGKREVVLRPNPEGLVISLSELAFFDSGSATMRPDARPAFQRIAKLLIEHELSIRVEGHTDNVPIHTAQFQTNWELSTARAVEVIKMLIVTYHGAPERLSAAGYGEFHPVATNATAEGRQQNRRVDLVVLAPILRPRAAGQSGPVQ